ncbi:MAG: DUF4358 domain-containing protein [Oscillospiraceae bacterium]
MKKSLIAILALLLALSVFTACGKKDTANTIKDGKTLTDVMTAVDAKFAEKYGADYGAVAMPMPVDNQYLTDMLSIDTSFVEESAGNIAMSMTNSDILIGLTAKEGKADALRTALEKRRDDLIAQYQTYPVNGSYERAKSGEVYQKGNYLFLIVVGVMPDNMDAALNFAPDVEMVKGTIDSMFNA